MASDSSNARQKSTKLVTFLGKGGSGKTTSAIFAAQHYAKCGYKTCLVINSLDPTAEFLLDRKIGTSPTTCNNNLSAMRLETSKMLLEPFNYLKKADAQLNIFQGALDGVVGEELGVLPGMDSIFAALMLEKLIGFLGNNIGKKHQQEKFDVVVYDGISTEETLRMIGSASKARLYLKHMRTLAQKTELGRVASPSLLRLVDEALNLEGNNSALNGRTSSEIWDNLEKILEKVSSVFVEPNRFGCYLVMDPKNPISVTSAMRYWGCSIQAGAHVSGAIGVSSPNSSMESMKIIMEDFSPLPYSFIQHVSMNSAPDWDNVISNKGSIDTRELLSFDQSHGGVITPSVKFDFAMKSVTLFMPGFEKSDIKLYQYRGRSELLVEAGDQRRVIFLPPQIQGKVAGAKFLGRSLVITLKP
ncbi:uncharacterized protein At1g26090, chloroplastic-like [Impatiens glandulifera]|uniref:uncharacterized protein At1g26090, chloroplastic-like n=1 Tax=Impatiens glandulifera TaxID=253017 RepID=UPI001FB16BE3|nr:uncharacterized protein At1g26090, chloroplastic-like [Impatiens glandulifera]